MKYKKVKTEKVVNLFSNNAVLTQNAAGRNTTFTFHLPYNFSKFSKNIDMNVANISYDNFEDADDDAILIFRCAEVNTEDVYDSTSGNGSIIYHSRGGNNDIYKPTFQMIQPLGQLTITITNDLTNRDNGVHVNDFFVMTLVIRDYDIEMVEPAAMPPIESYHHLPQQRINYF